ncbi:MAG: aldolase, partial [Calditrichaeota bacterium]|nr:aldolase [Calditrichota bacterium]
LTRTKAVIDRGAAGIVYGRNIIQHENPKAITKALMGIVHDGLSVEQALEFLN